MLEMSLECNAELDLHLHVPELTVTASASVNINQSRKPLLGYSLYIWYLLGFDGHSLGHAFLLFDLSTLPSTYMPGSETLPYTAHRLHFFQTAPLVVVRSII